MTDADDYSAACDDLADLGLTEDQIDDVWRWHKITACRQAQTAGGIVIMRLLEWAFKGGPMKKLELRMAALAWGFGLSKATGHASQDAHAAALGVTQQTLSAAAIQARKRIEG